MQAPEFANGWQWTVIPPKVPSRGYDTPYREQKIAAHATVDGQGKIARLRRRKDSR